MNSRSPRSSLASLLAAAALIGAAVTGCGDGAGAAGDPAAGAPANRSAGASVPNASTRDIPSGGPQAIKDFPVPVGAKFVNLGPAYGGNWQFGISSPGTDGVVAFYRKTLPAMGYTVKEDVSVQVGANTVQWELTFAGPTYGMVNGLYGNTLVTVDDKPLKALNP